MCSFSSECCIFGKQVTECTQECDYLKEVRRDEWAALEYTEDGSLCCQQIEMLTVEKREVNGQLRLLQDENTNYYHEIMVLVRCVLIGDEVEVDASFRNNTNR